MFVGHLAVALAAKRTAPRLSLGWLIVAAFLLDLLWPFLLALGVERVQVDPGATAFTPLSFEHYPWSHSLLMSVIWGAMLGTMVGRAMKSAVLLAAVVVSHWVLDFITHRPDLPLWPSGPEVGLGLWRSIPGTVVAEGALFAVGVVLYRRYTRATNRSGSWALWGLVTLCGAIWISGPLSPPPPSGEAVGMVAFAMWLFPLWGHWIERNRAMAVDE